MQAFKIMYENLITEKYSENLKQHGLSLKYMCLQLFIEGGNVITVYQTIYLGISGQ